MMEPGERLRFNSRDEWRAWLAEHHQEKESAWLVFDRTTSAKKGLTLGQAQEEALCFGWAEGELKPLNESTYAMRFSPRPRHSRWGRSNRARALKMLRAGKMTRAGMALLPPEVIRIWEKETPAQSKR